MSKEREQLLKQSENQRDASRAKPEHFRVKRVTNPGHGQYSEPESDQKSRFTGKGLGTNKRK